MRQNLNELRLSPRFGGRARAGLDFFSLDVEFFVTAAMASLDLQRIPIDVLLVEVRTDENVEHVQSSGYRFPSP